MSTTSTTHAPTFVVLGAGVVGLTTACELARRMPDSKITVVAKHFPGDIDPTEYCSPQAGANWASFEEEYNQRAQYDERSFRRFTALMREHPDCGVEAAPLRMVYGSSRRGGGDGDEDKDEPRPPKPWYAELLRFRQLARGALPEGADYGYEGTSLVINTAVYLSWLQKQCIRHGIALQRRSYDHLREVRAAFPHAAAVFNCTGLGARELGGVEDTTVYPVKGQTVLLEDTRGGLADMAMWFEGPGMGPTEFAHVFPRPFGGGIVVGGVRLANDWAGQADARRAETIKERACRLEPRLGKPQDLRVVRHNVGLRPVREDGVRVEAERHSGMLLIHNYGHAGAGYQSSWGTAEHAVNLLMEHIGADAHKTRL